MEKLARLMFKLFKGRRDTWSVRRGPEYFRISGRELTFDVYQRHLQGETIGIFPLLPTGSSCFVAAVDIDVADLDLAKAAQRLLPKPSYIERSRSGNYHIWFFFKEPVLVEELFQECNKALLMVKQRTNKHCNLYPRRAKGYGLLIALPLQATFVERGLTVFIEADSTIEAQHEFLRNVKYTQPPKTFLDNPKLKALWDGEGKKTGDTSASGYDFSFCLAMAKFGYTREFIAQKLSERPGVHQNTEEYIEQTVTAALGTARSQEKVEVETTLVDWASIEPIPRDVFLERLKKRLVLHTCQLRQFDLFFAAIIANLKTKGRPVWLLFIGPPGCGKTLPMMAVRFAPYVHMTSAFRPTALISGYGMKGGEDMSLIPKLHGKVLLVKDMSSLLSQHKEVVAEVLGLLRDAYDGSCSRPFGTGVERTYTSRFGFIGATTPIIDAHWSLNQQLGERFLRYRCRATPAQIYEKIDCALATLKDEDEVDLELENICLAYLKHLIEREPSNGQLRLADVKEIGRLAQLGAILRTVVARSAYGQEVLVLPEWEEATRYAKQLAKVAMSLAFIRGKDSNDEEEMEDLKALVRDSMDARIEHICAAIYKEPGLEASEVAARIGLPTWTARTCLDNLAVTRVMRYERRDFKLCWYFVPWIEGQLNTFKLWPKGDE